MADTLRVAVLVGSLRRGSFSRKVARAAIALAPNSLAMEIVEIGEIVTAFEQWIRNAPLTKGKQDGATNRRVSVGHTLS